MNQQVAIITGGSSGIGLNATIKLVERGIHCIIASRNKERVDEAVTKIKTDTGRDHVEGMELDLCDFSSVRKFVADFNAKNIPLNILINNAGLIEQSKKLTACGLESTFVANHLGHFLLTNLLLEKLRQSAPARVVIVASNMHDPNKGVGSRAILTLDTFNFENASFDSAAAYRFSKLANIWFSYRLASILDESGITVNCLEPGFIPTTNLSRGHSNVMRWLIVHVFGRFIKQTRTLDHAGNCLVDLATNPEITATGLFYDDMKVASTSERSMDAEEQQKMWDYSARVVGL